MNNLAELLLSYSVESVKLLVTVVVVVATLFLFLTLIVVVIMTGISFICDLVGRVKIEGIRKKVAKRISLNGVYRSGKDKW